MWCHFSFRPVLLQGDPQYSLQSWPTRAKIRCLALPCCSASHLAGTGVLGVAPRGWHSCRNKISCSLISGVRVLLQAPLCLPTAPSMDGELGGSWGGCRGVGVVVTLEGQYVSLWPCLPRCCYCCLGSKLLGALGAAVPRLMSARVCQL